MDKHNTDARNLDESSLEALNKAIDFFGGSQSKLSRAIGANSMQMVNNWIRRKRRVPAEWCPSIEEATAGTVPCELLRADVKWHVLRTGTPAHG